MLKVLNKIHNYDENKKQFIKNFLIYKNIKIQSIRECIILIEFDNFTLIVGDEITYNFNNFDDITLIIKNIFNNDNFKNCVGVWKNIYRDSKFFL
jgi:signal peptidase I